MHAELAYCDVSIIHLTPTWTSGSSTCVGDHFACLYTTRETAGYNIIRKYSLRYGGKYSHGSNSVVLKREREEEESGESGERERERECVATVLCE